MVELFSRLTGVPYPWSRYSQVVVSDFIFGGMENTTCTTLYEYVLLDERAALDVSSCDLVAHELAHQWFGDLVTCRDWSHAWLNEGFATFFEHIEREHRLGVDEYEYGVDGDISTYLAEADGRYQRPIVCREYMEPIDLFDRHLYEKGGLVLHMLRRQLGDDIFWAGIKDYIAKHQHDVVETNDLKRALEKSSGLSLERFFDQWVYRPGHPVFKVTASHERGLLSVTARQTQKAGDVSVFAFPFEVEVLHHDGKLKRYAKEATGSFETLVIHCKERPRYVAFDPDFKLTAQVSFELPGDMLRHQLKKGSNARSRWLAAESLSKETDFVTIKALGAALHEEAEAWMVRAEAARALATIGGTDSAELLLEGLSIKHPKVRRAVVTGLGKFRDPKVARALSARAKRDPSYLVEAEAARALGKTREPGVKATLLGQLGKRSWADVKMGGVIEGLAALRDEAPLDKLIEHTEYGVPTRARRAAIRALPNVSDAPSVRQHLEDLLDDGAPHVRTDVVLALSSLGNPKSKGALRRRLGKETDGRVTRQIREALRDIGGASGEQRRQADEIETLRRELGDLKTRIAKLEPQKSSKH
jgi:aminopeptidase N